jgi:DNA-binding transcriptional LysR family regulator
MELRHLEYVRAVARARSFTRAADDLHVAQPALSTAVRRLEGELGVRLFDRTTRRVELTPAGAAFVRRAARIGEEVDALAAEMHDFAVGLRGRLRLAVWYHSEPRLVPFLRDFVAATPGAEVSIVELAAPDILSALRDDDIDLATFVLYPGLDLGGVDYEVLRSEPYVLAVSPSHPLAGRAEVDLQVVAGLPLIAPRTGVALRTLLDRMVRSTGGDPRIVVEADEASAALAFASAGLGACLATPTIAGASREPLALVPIADVEPFVLAVGWRRGPHDLVVGRAIDMVLARAARDPGGPPLPI